MLSCGECKSSLVGMLVCMGGTGAVARSTGDCRNQGLAADVRCHPSRLPRAGADQATLRLRQLPGGTGVDHGTGYGRLAFSCPTADLQPLQEEVTARGYQVLTPLVRLDTPGKAAVQVVILADPDGHEVRHGSVWWVVWEFSQPCFGSCFGCFGSC